MITPFLFLLLGITGSSLPLPPARPRLHTFYQDKLDLFSFAPKTDVLKAIDPILNNNSTVTQEL